jgi:hypothetical protein
MMKTVWETIADWRFVLKMIVVLGAVVVIATNISFAPAPTPPVTHDHGRTPIVSDRFCDGWPADPTPLRCDQILWCWTHHGWEAIDWPLAEAIPLLKELEARSW